MSIDDALRARGVTHKTRTYFFHSNATQFEIADKAKNVCVWVCVCVCRTLTPPPATLAEMKPRLCILDE